jgi:hypothetical protein
MATASEILNDPNYINANAATKRAIFERRIATLPEYRNANLATQKQIQTRFGVSAAAKVAPPAPAPTFMEDAGNYMRGIALGAASGDPAALLARGGTYLTDVLGLTTGANEKINAVLNAGENTQNKMVRGGKGVGEFGVSIPAIATGGAGVRVLGGQLARVAPRAGGVVQRVGQAVSSGGIGSGRTAAQTAAMPLRQRQAQLLERAAGGAIAGAGGAALAGEDVGTGAEFGAALPAVGSIVRKVAGVLPDLFNLPALQAARILRESLGDNVDAARAALSALPANAQELVRQTLVRAGIEPRTFMGLAADVEKLRPDQAGGILEGQAAAREARLAQAAGGPTATATRAATEVARRDVSRATGPARDVALERANVAGREVPRAEVLAEAARRAADQITESGVVPRMRGLETRSREQLDTVFQNPAFFTQSQPVVRTGQVAEKAGEFADTGINQQLGLRQTARDLEDYVADLAAQGMQPLTVAPITQSIRTMAAQPGTRASKLQRRALVTAANQLDALADANGVIDARDLYQFRKSELGDIVNVLLSGRNMPPSGVKEGAASLMSSIRPMIDDAIEGAGGVGFKDYLTRTRQGFEAVNRQELGGKAAQLAKESPNEFIALMRGDRPQIVEDVMGRGTGQYDIFGMALADPNRFKALQQSANELGVLNRMGELSSQGSTAATELIGRERPFVSRALTRVGLAAFPPARIGADAAQVALASALKPRVQQQLAEAAVSGPNALALMNQYPTSLRMSEAVSNLSPGMRNALAQLLRSGTMNYNQ